MANAVGQVRAELEARLQDELTAAAELAKAGEALEAERDGLQDQVAALTTERDTHAGRVAQLEADLAESARAVDQVRAELGQRIEQEQQATEAARVELAKAQLRAEANATAVAEQRAEIERLRAELARESAARVQAEQAAAVAGAKLEAMEHRASRRPPRPSAPRSLRLKTTLRVPAPRPSRLARKRPSCAVAWLLCSPRTRPLRARPRPSSVDAAIPGQLARHGRRAVPAGSGYLS